MDLVTEKSLQKLNERLDSWQNTVTGHGTTRDKTTYASFVSSHMLNEQTLDDLYSTAELVSTVCNAFPEEYFKKDFKIKIYRNGDYDEKLSKLVKRKLGELSVKDKFTDSFIWSNVFGNCGCFIGVDDDQELSEPLDLRKVKNIDHLNVIDKRDLIPVTFQYDSTQPNYGRPNVLAVQNYGSQYRGQQATLEAVHSSRFIMFDGVRVSNRRRQQLHGWNLSLIQNLYDAIHAYGIGFKNFDNLLYDANQGVLKFKDLMTYIAKQDYSVIQARLQAMDLSRSVVRSIVVDAEKESFERQNFNWSGIDKPFMLLMLRVSAVSRIPVAILMGREPAGLNATGESDFRTFYDRVESDQQNKVTPKLKQLIAVILATQNVYLTEEDDIQIIYDDLNPLNLKDKAEVIFKVAQADNLNIANGLVTEDEVSQSRFTADGWNIETTIDNELRDKLREAEEELQRNAGQTDDAQKEVLNGAQMQAIADIVSRIGADEEGITESQAMGILRVALPKLTDEQVRQIVVK